MGCYCREQEQAGLYQWATAQLIITLGRADALLNTQDVIVSFVQGKNRLDLHKADLEIDASTLFAVGDGTSHVARSNAFEVVDGGIVLKSPNGTRYKVTVDDSGNLSTTAL